ncbi:small GTP-binding protein [Tritrichomonas foetus]|uniref:Small GTP-binding protein n=1 Tax=Tritrichomonas foetus TaxID=1144522 RepID=A0A1J4KNU2_9EUKA|nr:small GTP-binding protein [Tritrichomonas foetus]|eukprot:OHT12961.1 small GTP-binding protein [Tritrichomonas foetus]
MLINSPEIKDVKLVMLGSTTVGKTSIVTRLIRENFQSDTVSTIGASYLSQTINVNGIQVKLQIWDTGGSERYRAMAPMYFHDADACLIVYDITSKNSFEDVDNWLKELKEKGPAKVLVALAGNKCDLEQLRCIKKEYAQEYCNKCNIRIFHETSALNGQNINQIFYDIAQKMTMRGTAGRRSSVDITLPPQKKNTCC